MKKFFICATAAALAVCLAAGGAFARGWGGRYCQDADGGWVCVRRQTACLYSDADGDGVCDLRADCPVHQAGGHHAGGRHGAGWGRGCR